MRHRIGRLGPRACERPTRRTWTLRDQAGWTLAEVMVVTGMILALAGIAVPQYSQLASQMRTQSAAVQILADVSWARAMSLRTGRAHYLNFTGAPVDRYDIHRADAGFPVDPASDPIERSIDLADQMPGVEFSLNGATLDPYGAPAEALSSGAFVFGGQGLPEPIAGRTFYVASIDGSWSFAVSVTAAGHARMWRRRNGGWE